MSKSTAATKTADKPAKAAAKAVASPKVKPAAKVTNKTPDAAKPATPAKRTRKPAAAKVEAVTPEQAAPVAAVVTAQIMATVPVAAEPAKRGRGRPISSEAAKVRRRVVGSLVKLAATGEIEVTVKATAKAVKLKKVTVSNTIRWAESEGILTRIGYKLKSGPGRKEVFYTINADKLAEAAKAAA